MTGAEAAERRKALGYTQAALAKLLGTSSPTMARWEAAESAPEALTRALGNLQPSPGGGRGPYRRAAAGKAPPEAPSAPPARQRRREGPTPPPVPKARRKPAQAPPPLPVRLPPAPEVQEAEAVGAVLLEDMSAHAERVAELLGLEDATRHARRVLPPPRYPVAACQRCPWKRCPVPLVAAPAEGCCLWR
ncbi:helix-turn-helix domain-containing protein [Stigmatella erecta]|uniref:Helix-turn-helix n=1 Tax=Stigmatella erecta TaxID=83460 RepID=A0A1I0L9W2_9BACT|nr:helix-turn-helix domain-containing protein [Stigmatella erecta]SEU36906.1 Helix-turn-helix [Stigmatella erecta]